MNAVSKAVLAGSLALLALPGLSLAGPPPENSLPISRIVQTIEMLPGFAYLQQISWDEDTNEWVGAYRDANGLDKNLRVDPISGQMTEDGAGASPSGGEPSTATMDEVPPPAGVEGEQTTPSVQGGGTDSLLPAPSGESETSTEDPASEQ